MKRVLTAILALLFITSCFQYEEDMVLKKDGSGEVTVKFVFGKFISSMMDLDEDMDKQKIKFYLRNDKGLKILDESVYERNGRRVYEVSIKFDHYKYLKNLDLESDEYGDDMEMDIRDFFDDISFDGKSYERRIDLDNNDNDDEDVPRFLSKMVDIEFHFSVQIEGSKSKDWTYDLNDLANKENLIMKIN